MLKYIQFLNFYKKFNINLFFIFFFFNLNLHFLLYIFIFSYFFIFVLNLTLNNSFHFLNSFFLKINYFFFFNFFYIQNFFFFYLNKNKLNISFFNIFKNYKWNPLIKQYSYYGYFKSNISHWNSSYNEEFKNIKF